MMTLIFLVLALVLFILATVGIGAPRFNLIAGGLAAWVASQLVGTLVR